MTDIKLHHLAIVVDDMEAALRFWGERLGLSPTGAIESVADEAVTIAFLTLGEARLELIQPTSDEGGVANYLAKRGPGLHHLCLEVDDLDAKLEELAQAGCQLINEKPRERAGERYAFVHPKSAGGVLLELYETSQVDSSAAVK